MTSRQDLQKDIFSIMKSEKCTATEEQKGKIFGRYYWRRVMFSLLHKIWGCGILRVHKILARGVFYISIKSGRLVWGCGVFKYTANLWE
jgi:hypothetical protein